jgi:hypothetical protein
MTTKSLPIAALAASFDMTCSGIDRSDLDAGVNQIPANGRGQETVYRFLAGPTDHISTLRIGDYPANGNGGRYNKSAKLDTWAKEVDAEGVEKWSPFTATLSTGDGSFDGIVDPTDYSIVIMMLMSVFIPGALTPVNPDTVGEPSLAAINLSRYGVSSIAHVAVE